jgi:4-hydroxy-tetrahydrodipicolinate reductase
MSTIILGDGPLGRAIAGALEARGEPATILGRPLAGRHDRGALTAADVIVDASRSGAVLANVEAGLDAGCRRFVVATTGWDTTRAVVADRLLDAGATAVVAPNLSLGAALFLRLVSDAAEQAAAFGGFEPAIVEWHRRAKADRPSGTARELVRRIDPHLPIGVEEVAVVRAGAMPGHHVVAFDAAGETVELRLTARDRSAYAAGALAAIDWLRAADRVPGIQPFDRVVDDLLDRTRPAIDRPARPAA